jgi:hypothetical protein
MLGRRLKEVQMARRPELFIRELSDEEATHLLRLARAQQEPDLAQGDAPVPPPFRARACPKSPASTEQPSSATHVADLFLAFNERGFPALDHSEGRGPTTPHR